MPYGLARKLSMMKSHGDDDVITSGIVFAGSNRFSTGNCVVLKTASNVCIALKVVVSKGIPLGKTILNAILTIIR